MSIRPTQNKVITSDDVLDLVEVNDLLELDNGWEILKVLGINKDNQPVCLVRTSSNIEEYAFKDYRKKHITAIYKRQLNGDYKRYEVKGKEKNEKETYGKVCIKNY